MIPIWLAALLVVALVLEGDRRLKRGWLAYLNSVQAVLHVGQSRLAFEVMVAFGFVTPNEAREMQGWGAGS